MLSERNFNYSLKIKSPLGYFLWLIFMVFIAVPPGHLFSRDILKEIKGDYKSGKLSHFEYMMVGGWIVTGKELPDQFKIYRGERAVKCGFEITAHIRDYLSLNRSAPDDLFKILERPELQISHIDSSGRFKIHYDVQGPNAVDITSTNPEGIPDYIYEAEKALQFSWKLLINSMKFNPPPSDFGRDGEEIDIYILDLKGSDYGYTVPEEEITDTERTGDYSSYIVVDNDFSESGYYTNGIDGLKVTLAHELFHVIQLGYNLHDGDVYFFELSSTWFEDFAYDEINDYIHYLQGFFLSPGRTLTQYEGYEISIFMHFLTGKFGVEIVKQIWDKIIDVPAINALNWILNQPVYDVTLGEVLAEFSLWNYFTGSRWVPERYYREAKLYPEISFQGDLSFDDSVYVEDFVNRLSSKYLRFKPDQTNLFTLTFDTENAFFWEGTILIHRFTDEVLIKRINPEGYVFLDTVTSLTYVVFIPTNGRILKGPISDNRFSVFIKRSPVDLHLVNRIVNISPNPFYIYKNLKNMVRFELSHPVELKVVIYSITGREVKRMDLKLMDSGLNKFGWDGRDMSDKPVSTGIYFYRIFGRGVDIKAKVTVIK
ncbi:MAG: MXAN_6640 family putative metalloprotease [Fidelibacterota bacterium]